MKQCTFDRLVSVREVGCSLNLMVVMVTDNPMSLINKTDLRGAGSHFASCVAWHFREYVTADLPGMAD